MLNKWANKENKWTWVNNFVKTNLNLIVIIVAALLIELTTGVLYYSSQDIIRHMTIRVIVLNNPMILGSCIACVPNLFPLRGYWFEPYSVRRPDGTVETMQLGSKRHDYIHCLPRFLERPLIKD